MMSRGSSSLWPAIGREELPLAASGALLSLQHPGTDTLLMIEMLAFELDNFIIILNSFLANRASQRILLMKVNCCIPTLIYFIEGYIFDIFLYFLKNAGIPIKPSFSCILTHCLHGGDLLRS